ncbi:PREDICTED: uncharacterized protein LOC108768196 [Trachymyrmex cornetzi]|uniref:uncharacterized protein LOC108768196 n=1 Tax=Trachymyrmex cornetzi TaxID=471704 RepID=UPI00084F3BB5|nr:PREDICTED: uncharacterized protein LOC108768196 [Trachymyrmex cornetzi]
MDNKKKLKLNAVPTIFGYFLEKKVPFNNQNFGVVEDKSTFISDDCNEDQIIVNDKQIAVNETVEVNAKIINTFPNTSTKCTSSTTEIDGKKEKDKNKKLEQINRKIQIHLTLMHKRMSVLRSKILRLENTINNDKYKKALKEVFNEGIKLKLY